MYSFTQIFPTPHSNDLKSFVGGRELILRERSFCVLRLRHVGDYWLYCSIDVRYTTRLLPSHPPPGFLIVEENAISKYSSLSTIKFLLCKVRTTFRLWSDTYSLNIFMYRYMGHTNKIKKIKLILWCNVPMNIYSLGLILEIRKNSWKNLILWFQMFKVWMKNFICLAKILSSECRIAIWWDGAAQNQF